MQRQSTKILASIILITQLFFLPTSLTAQTPDDIADKAINEYRQNKPGKGIDQLEVILSIYPRNSRVRDDLIVIHASEGNPDRAIELIGGVEITDLSIDVQSAVALAYRKTGQFARSASIYQLILLQDGADANAMTGFVLAKSEAGQPKEAIQQGDNWIVKFGKSDAVIDAIAYAYRFLDDDIAVLNIHTDRLHDSPNNNTARRSQVLALENLGAHILAYDLAIKHPVAFENKEILRLKANAASVYNRWGHLEPEEFAKRYETIDISLKMLEELLSDSADNENLADLHRRIRFDQIANFDQRGRMDAVITHYEALIAKGIDPPAYVVQSAANAYSFNEQGQTALELYRGLHHDDPDSIALSIGLFYALLDTQNHGEALSLIDALEAATPIWYRLPGSNQQFQHPDKMQVLLTATLARLYISDYDSAQTRLESLAALAPGNSAIRMALGDLYAARGWQNKASDEYVRARILDDKNRQVHISQAYNDLNRRDYSKTRDAITKIVSAQPEAKPVHRLNRTLELHDMRQINLSGDFSKSSGSTFGSQSSNIDARFYSAPIDENYRVYVPLGYSSANFEEGWERQPAGAIGLEYRAPDYLLEGDVGYKGGSKTAPSANLAGRWYVNDHLDFGGNASLYSDDTPLRASKNDITSNGLGIDVNYMWNESQFMAASFSLNDYSDGNLRQTISARGGANILRKPDLVINASASLYASKNSEKNTAYYNPEKDTSFQLKLDGEQLFHQEYDQTFWMGASFETGPYYQKNFGAHNIWDLRYWHRWTWDDQLSFNYGMTISDRTYDGDQEDNIGGFGGLTLRY